MSTPSPVTKTSTENTADLSSCPCGTGQPYTTCCEPFHTGTHAPTPQQLMRSRYCAYALGKVDYLIYTTHRDNAQNIKNQKKWQQELLQYCQQTEFLGLTVTGSGPEEITPETKTGWVSFEAHLSHKGNAFILKERSKFARVGQRWVYHSGEAKTEALPSG